MQIPQGAVQNFSASGEIEVLTDFEQPCCNRVYTTHCTKHHVDKLGLQNVIGQWVSGFNWVVEICRPSLDSSEATCLWSSHGTIQSPCRFDPRQQPGRNCRVDDANQRTAVHLCSAWGPQKLTECLLSSKWGTWLKSGPLSIRFAWTYPGTFLFIL